MTVQESWFKARHYLHFDQPISYESAKRIVENPTSVQRHSFYPLISYETISESLKKDKITKKVEKIQKIREIRYAAHVDSHIYSYFSKKLTILYEEKLLEEGLCECVLAFRELGKSNIDFALQAFNVIKSQGECTAIALDISGFFDNLDHLFLKKMWANVLGLSHLPPDHFAVFQSITKYSFVEKEKLFKLLDISIHNPKNGRIRICEPLVFRNKVRSSGLVQQNNNKYGIPQGSSISALLSNIYMLEFDAVVNKEIDSIGGKYFRYCDDMIFIVPNKYKTTVLDFVSEKIKEVKLEINSKKTEIREFSVVSEVLVSDKPLQYLGFTYDGSSILIRSAALERYSDKMKRGIRLAKLTMNKRNQARLVRGVGNKELFRKQILTRYSHLGKRNFVRYGFNAAEIMQSDEIKKQLKPLWNRMIKEINK